MKDERFDPSDGFGPDDWEYDEDDDFDDWFLTIQPVLDGYLESADTLTDGRTVP